MPNHDTEIESSFAYCDDDATYADHSFLSVAPDEVSAALGSEAFFNDEKPEAGADRADASR